MFWRALKIGGVRSHQYFPCPPTNFDYPPLGSPRGRALPQVQLGRGLHGTRRTGPSHCIPFVCPLGKQRHIGQSRPLCLGDPNKLRVFPGQPPVPSLSPQHLLLWGGAGGLWKVGAEQRKLHLLPPESQWRLRSWLGNHPLFTIVTKASWVIYFPLIFPVSAPCLIRTVEHTRVKTDHPFRPAAAESKSAPLLLPWGTEVCRSGGGPPGDWAGPRPQLQRAGGGVSRLCEPLQREQAAVMLKTKRAGGW